MKTMTQIFLTAMFAVALTFLTFAASFAETPRSEIATASLASHE